jgi:hypothetical protein
MDNYFIQNIINSCPVLKFKFAGVWSADNFPVLKKQTFIVVNASQSIDRGTHWLLLASLDEDSVVFWDSLGHGIESYLEIYLRCVTQYSSVRHIILPLQGQFSNLCGPYCIYMAHLIFENKDIDKLCLTTFELVDFINQHCGSTNLLFKII